jgi:ubiquinone biosynthesis protein
MALTLAYGTRFLFRRSNRPQLVREYFERCGGGFVKVGQVLSMRYDLLATSYCEALQALLDELPPAPAAEVVAVVESELGARLDALFETFDVGPASSASIAQVHFATLPGGTPVVAKVKRPGIDRIFAIDLTNARLLAHTLDALGWFRDAGLPALVREIEQLTAEELDFRHEARNLDVVHALLDSDPIDHCSPRPYLALCSASVITMERLQGVWMRDLLAAVTANDRGRLEAWAQHGITPARTARLLLRSILEQCFSHRIFHADPHAGNLVILDGGTLGYVDFGMIGWIDEKGWAQQFRMNASIANEKLHGAYQSLLDILEPLPPRDLSRFEIEFKRHLQNWLFSTRTPNGPLAERSSAVFFLRLFELLRRWQLSMPSSQMRLNRALMIADIIILQLYPALLRLPELRAYFRDEVKRQFDARLEDHSITALQASVTELFRAGDAARELVYWVQERLPHLGRTYREGITRLERAALATLRYVRVAVVLAVAALIAHRALGGRLLGGVVPVEGLGWWAGIAGSVLVTLALTDMIRKVRDSR